MRADHDQRRGAGADEEPLDAAVPERNPGCLVIAGNTSFTDLSDSRVKTEIAEADVAELQQLFDSVEAKQYKHERGPEAGLCLGRLRRNEVEEFDGDTRWSDGTEMVTLDYSHLTSVLWGVCQGFQARLDALEAWQPSGGQRTSRKKSVQASSF